MLFSLAVYLSSRRNENLNPHPPFPLPPSKPYHHYHLSTTHITPTKVQVQQNLYAFVNNYHRLDNLIHLEKLFIAHKDQT